MKQSRIFPALNKDTVAYCIADLKGRIKGNTDKVTIEDVAVIFYTRLQYDYPDLTYQEFVDTINNEAANDEVS